MGSVWKFEIAFHFRVRKENNEIIESSMFAQNNPPWISLGKNRRSPLKRTQKVAKCAICWESVEVRVSRVSQVLEKSDSIPNE